MKVSITFALIFWANCITLALLTKEMPHVLGLLVIGGGQLLTFAAYKTGIRDSRKKTK